MDQASKHTWVVRPLNEPSFDHVATSRAHRRMHVRFARIREGRLGLEALEGSIQLCSSQEMVPRIAMQLSVSTWKLSRGFGAVAAAETLGEESRLRNYATRTDSGRNQRGELRDGSPKFKKSTRAS